MQPEAPTITEKTYGTPKTPAAMNFTKLPSTHASDTSAKELGFFLLLF